mmetsp:Transcript_75385/g.157102  ORF Transcript_75385/g.157102 Transcript_75385/m.157102 type:complete len:208 (-) Transcript_75385:2859-3482(-)
MSVESGPQRDHEHHVDATAWCDQLPDSVGPGAGLSNHTFSLQHLQVKGHQGEELKNRFDWFHPLPGHRGEHTQVLNCREGEGRDDEDSCQGFRLRNVLFLRCEGKHSQPDNTHGNSKPHIKVDIAFSAGFATLIGAVSAFRALSAAHCSGVTTSITSTRGTPRTPRCFPTLVNHHGFRCNRHVPLGSHRVREFIVKQRSLTSVWAVT